MRERAIAALGLAALLLAVADLASCGECAGVGCVANGVTVNFVPPITGPGTWTVALRTSESTSACTVRVPPPPPPDSIFGTTPCKLELTMEEKDDSVTIWLLHVSGTPSSLSVSVAHDGKAAGEVSANPQYKPFVSCGKTECMDGGAYDLAVSAP